MVPSARHRPWVCMATPIAACTVGRRAYGRAAEAATERTLREIVHLGMGRDQVRIRLINAFGTDGVALDGVTAGLRASRRLEEAS